MWGLFSAGILAALLILYFLGRALRKRRTRSTRWENLRERSKLIASQLSHLRDVQAKKDNLH